MEPITSFSGDFRFLSNFWPAEVVLGKDKYPTVEHAYQASKTDNRYERRRIQIAVTPGYAKRMGKKVTIRPSFEGEKLSIMMDLLRQKFSKPELGKLLIATGSRELIEGNAWGDIYWGVCDGTGHNHLGKLLMEVRREIGGKQ